MIKIGTTLTLVSENEKSELIHYRCKVVELDHSVLYIDYPINEQSGRTDIFPEGTIFQANFVGEDQSVYQFQTEIKGKKMGQIPMLLLDYSKNDMTRIQRREYVRVTTALDIAMHDPNHMYQAITTLTYDISGGGLSIVFPHDYNVKPGDEVEVWLVLPMDSGKTEYVTAYAEAIRIFQKKDANKALLSMKFTKIAEKDRQQIIRYCFEVQLKIRRQNL
ncbi:hypothetical protein GCM10011351_05730 [Paraliobacillus quinghaiensis]|uniref:Pilus assembly protein PilZ n=1 Tax=Paraliobacillus quinghaiensis TaxID=470815 RepID=A0A917WRH3_9BACI|nr:flagellar brake domain-containing protein [Paraliobacillus quinghaiensis]GGM22756.1 hypothetical protein GCM10011351_05730 [Paraliobacillus quinghaiensis]